MRGGIFVIKEKKEILLNDKIIKKLLAGSTKSLKQYVKEIIEEITQKEIQNIKLIHPISA